MRMKHFYHATNKLTRTAQDRTGEHWPLILVCTDIAALGPPSQHLGLMFLIEFNTANTLFGYTRLLLLKRD